MGCEAFKRRLVHSVAFIIEDLSGKRGYVTIDKKVSVWWVLNRILKDFLITHA